MYCSFLLKYKNKYIKIWNGKEDNIITTSYNNNARIFEIGWILKNKNNIKKNKIIIIPIHKEIHEYDFEIKDIEELNISEPLSKNQCVCCGSKTDIKYKIKRRGYGSIFDDMKIEFNLCNSCKPKELDTWINELPIKKDYWEEYKYEDNLNKFFESLPINGQEIIFNENNINQKTWMLIEKGLLNHNKYEEYNIYSPAIRQAYYTKFPTCKHPSVNLFNDGSKNSKCVYGALGSVSTDLKPICSSNMYDDCFKCNHYIKK